MKLVNRKQGILICAGYTFEPNVVVEVPDEIGRKLLQKPSLMLEEVKDGKEKIKEKGQEG